MSEYLSLRDVGRLPALGDNTAIAVRLLPAGLDLEHLGHRFVLSHTVLEGHRFAVQAIPAGSSLLSWGLSFGTAVRDIARGEYVANSKMLHVLRDRGVEFALPDAPNFEDSKLEPYAINEATFSPGIPLSPASVQLCFEGYDRGPERGVGTRNYVVILGATSHASSYARALAERFTDAPDDFPNVTGVVPLAHTEGGGTEVPNNLDLLLRTLAGFVVHPNVGAVLIANDSEAPVSNEMLRSYLEDHQYPLDSVLHEFLTMDGGWATSLQRGEELVRSWLPRVNRFERTSQPASKLRIALQCGGSDAFSGVSGNPLAAAVAREIIRQGGAANLAETDELIGAEQYVLSNVRDLDTAKQFLTKIAEFKELVGRHGHTAEDNPSGGNNYRGLYNITIKSIGAAMKRDPLVRLDHVLGYGERMQDTGYHFMDSPGNDLESIAGQVASGCNMIFFVTGNGSITNFPFVPTLKVVTTSRRYELLKADMDVNAGAYLDGVPFEQLTDEMLDLTLRVASGESSAGERAGHSQVSIWRNWARTSPLEAAPARPEGVFSGAPIPLASVAGPSGVRFDALLSERGPVTDQVALVLPTSLCSGQISRMVAERLNQSHVGEGKVTRFVALPHTEGCGVSAGSAEQIYTRTLLGYLRHPIVAHALLLEHGCEKTHNDYLRLRLQEAGGDPGQFGWASVQLDGGIARVMDKVQDWFAATLEAAPIQQHSPTDLRHLRLGIASVGHVPDRVADALAQLTSEVVAAGGYVVAPENTTLLDTPQYRKLLPGGERPGATLAYGQTATENGFHVMESPTRHWVETLTGLGATGVEVVLVYTEGRPLQAHRLIPVLQVTREAEAGRDQAVGFDLVLGAEPELWARQMLDKVLSVASREYQPVLFQQGNTDFQFTRGLLGVSM